MAINKKLIHFKKYSDFVGSSGINGTTSPTNGYYHNIPENSIVFIQDTQQIWTHGQFYDGSEVEVPTKISELEDDVISSNYFPISEGNTLISFMNFYEGCNTVTSLSSIPITKRLIIATITNNQTLSLGNTLSNGRELNIIIKNNSSSEITITLPTSSNIINFDGTSLTISSGNYGEINIISDGTNIYSRTGTINN